MADSERSAFLVVDAQNDFCDGGALAVPGSDRVLAALNRHIAEAIRKDIPIYASRDWHPAVTTHFKGYGGEWPVHCVQGSAGARFHSDLRLPEAATVVTKGEGNSPGYSAIEGFTPDGARLLDHLRQRGITHLYVGGLATDYCVKHSVLDALAAGFKVTLLEDAIAGVDVSPGDSARALAEMRQRGATLSKAGELPQDL